MLHNVRLGPSLAFLILASLTGLVGFLIVYHYASYERPVQRFAVIIDAGSTQTRSNLYSISIDPFRLGQDTEGGTPLSDLIQVREVAGCVNGGPLAAINSPDDANQLLAKCMLKFAHKIKRLDFLNTVLDGKAEDMAAEDEGDNRLQDTEELDRQMALLNHRVNSVTHIHLGATAGMRALELVDHQRADQRIRWIQSAIAFGNTNLLAGTVYMNPGYVGIIKGTSEASFGWLSVNFVCEKLHVPEANAIDTPISSLQHPSEVDSSYTLEGSEENWQTIDGQPAPESIGTLELGGASAQMAFQNTRNSSKYLNGSMQADHLVLFGSTYELSTRSDLCLGMSQAILRTNYILLREYFDQKSSQPASSSRAAVPTAQVIAIENPCQQNGSRSVGLSKGMIESILNGACLEVSPEQRIVGEKFKQFITSSVAQSAIAKLNIVGTGDVNRCDQLLARLIEPQECRKMFLVCPDSKNKQQPPEGMPFVTISGYNKALMELNLSRQRQPQAIGGVERSASDQLIEDKLGGYSVDYGELEQKTRTFCSLNIEEFPRRFPKMNKRFYDVNCLQMIYIRKLLTEFYLFRPDTPSWRQIRFLLFASKEGSEQVFGKERALDRSGDIGWTLGLLLNATSWELWSEGADRPPDVVFHHGASVQFIIRTTVLLMFACVLIAASIVVCSLLLARRGHRSAYVCHSEQVSAAPAGRYQI